MDERELVGFAVVGDDFVLVYDEEELGEVVGEWGEGDFYVRKRGCDDDQERVGGVVR